MISIEQPASYSHVIVANFSVNILAPTPSLKVQYTLLILISYTYDRGGTSIAFHWEKTLVTHTRLEPIMSA